MTTLRDIGATLRSYRKRKGLTVSALADASHVHRNTLSALENGTGNVELNTLLGICEQLGLELLLAPGRVGHLLREEALHHAPAGEQASTELSPLQKRIAERLRVAGKEGT